MKDSFKPLSEWTEVARTLLSGWQRESKQHLAGIEETVRLLREGSVDPRWKILATRVGQLKQHIDAFCERWCEDLVKELEAAIEAQRQAEASFGLQGLIDFFRQTERLSAGQLCETLLDWLLERTGAERGFVLFCQPESLGANVAAARNYASTHLALAEYDFSRTLLGELLRSASPLLLEDACQDPHYSRQASIRRQRVLSVLAVPLRQGDRNLGAIYLEESRRPAAFSPLHASLLEAAGVLLMLCLRAGGLLPAVIGAGQEVFLDEGRACSGIVGRDPKILALLDTIERIADAPATILIQGESGTGKELVARALHERSRRREGPFVAINCAAIPESLLESELFGHERGAFTGAVEPSEGRLAAAHLGTLFLDEVSELAYPMQAKLLRFLQSKEFQRLGGRETVRVDVRIIAATSKNLLEMASAGRFQEALYFRLNVIPVEVPTLSERSGDIELLGRHFLQRYQSLYGKAVQIRPEVWECLRHHDFPGNVRELENLIHRLVALSGSQPVSVADLPPEVLPLRTKSVSLARDDWGDLLSAPATDLQDLRQRRARALEQLAQQEAELARRTVRDKGSVSAAARHLGIHRVTLHKLLRRSSQAVADAATNPAKEGRD